MSENQKKIWITGASSGIGRAVAEKFAKEGWKVAVSARREEILNEMSKDENIFSFPLDVTSIDNCKNTFDKISISEKDIISNLTNVYDPEIPVNIYDLGLIYDINISKGNNVFIKMSLTSPGCPVAGELPKQVADELTKIKNIGLIEVELVWDPPWTKERMSEDAKLALDI
mgnify:CR=1 FL=1